MPSNESSLLCQLTDSIEIQIRSIGLIIFDFLLNMFVRHLTVLYPLVKFVGRYIQVVCGIITGNHCSLVNVSDNDFNIETTADELFNENLHTKDYNQPDSEDIFHIYLSKVLYESSDQIKRQCRNWGFREGSSEVLTYIQLNDLKRYSYATQAAVIHHKQSHRIIIAFRGTEPMDLLQWLTDATTNFMTIYNAFNDVNGNNADQIQVHAGFYSALGLSEFNPARPIDFNNINAQTPMFIQLTNAIEKIRRNDSRYKISITGHSLGGALASLFTFVLLSYGYKSSISALYTYGQPLVGNRCYADILNDQLGNRIHRWVNHADIVTRIPFIELPSIAWYYARTPYSDALEVATNNIEITSDQHSRLYFHSGLRFKINGDGNLIKDDSIDQGSIRALNDRFDLLHIRYSIANAIHSLFHITPFRSILWLFAATQINDHFPCDYARKIKEIVNKRNE